MVKSLDPFLYRGMRSSLGLVSSDGLRPKLTEWNGYISFKLSSILFRPEMRFRLKPLMISVTGLVPRPLPDLISQLWRKNLGVA